MKLGLRLTHSKLHHRAVLIAHRTGLQSHKTQQGKFRHAEAWRWTGGEGNENRSTLPLRPGSRGTKPANDREQGDGKTSRGGNF